MPELSLAAKIALGLTLTMGTPANTPVNPWSWVAIFYDSDGQIEAITRIKHAPFADAETCYAALEADRPLLNAAKQASLGTKKDIPHARAELACQLELE